MAGSIRRFFANIICGCIYNKDTRKRVRAVINSDMISYLRFIRKNTGLPIRKIKTFTGYQARSLLVSVNDKYIFKFPLRRSNSDALALREARIVDTFRKISPIYVPPVEIFYHRGRVIRRYEYIRGTMFRQLPLDVALSNIDKLASQIANFIFTIGESDPVEIRDLKSNPRARPKYMHGWTQQDVCDNFFVDAKTMQIIAFIDWEDSEFRDFSKMIFNDKRSPNRELMDAVKREYDKLYFAKHKDFGGN